MLLSKMQNLARYTAHQNILMLAIMSFWFSYTEKQQKSSLCDCNDIILHPLKVLQEECSPETDMTELDYKSLKLRNNQTRICFSFPHWCEKATNVLSFTISIFQVFNWSDKALFGLIRGQSRWQLKKHARGGRGMWLSNRLRPKTLVTLDQEVTGYNFPFIHIGLRQSLLHRRSLYQMSLWQNFCIGGHTWVKVCHIGIWEDCLCHLSCIVNLTSEIASIAGPLSFLIRDQRLDAHSDQWLSELRTACESKKQAD